jgi:hypothetical protein
MPRLQSDVEWKMKDERYQLSEDGFCNTCNEFHDECFCEAFWIRQYNSSDTSLRKTIKDLGLLTNLVAKIENQAVCAAIAPPAEVLEGILRILISEKRI